MRRSLRIWTIASAIAVLFAFLLLSVSHHSQTAVHKSKKYTVEFVLKGEMGIRLRPPPNLPHSLTVIFEVGPGEGTVELESERIGKTVIKATTTEPVRRVLFHGRFPFYDVFLRCRERLPVRFCFVWLDEDSREPSRETPPR